MIALLYFATAALRPTPESLQAAQRAFNKRFDAESDAVLSPLIVDQTAEIEEAEKAFEEFMQPRPTRKPTRGFQFSDPKRRRGPLPPTFDERLDAAGDAALTPAVLRDNKKPPRRKWLEPKPLNKPDKATQPLEAAKIVASSGPERAALWLERKYIEIFGEIEEEEPPRPPPRRRRRRRTPPPSMMAAKVDPVEVGTAAARVHAAAAAFGSAHEQAAIEYTTQLLKQAGEWRWRGDGVQGPTAKPTRMVRPTV